MTILYGSGISNSTRHSGRNLPHVATLEQFIQESHDLALCGIIMTEILQGIADDPSYKRVQRYLDPLIILPMSQSVNESLDNYPNDYISIGSLKYPILF